MQGSPVRGGAETYGGDPYIRLGSRYASANVVLCQSICCVLGTHGLDSDADAAAAEPVAAASTAPRPAPEEAIARPVERQPWGAPLMGALTRCSNFLERQLG